MSLTLKSVKVKNTSRSVASGWTGVVDRMSSRKGYAWVQFKTLLKPLEIAVSQLEPTVEEKPKIKLEGNVAVLPGKYRGLFNSTSLNGDFLAACSLVYTEDGVEYGNFVAYGEYAEIPTAEVTEIFDFESAGIASV